MGIMSLNYPPPFQDLRTLSEHVCLGESTIEAMVKENRFPQPRRNKCGKRLWVWKEVEAWLAEPENTPLEQGEAIYAATLRAINAR